MREVTHGQNLFPSMTHHAPNTIRSCQASGRLDPGLDIRKPLQLARMYEIQEFCTAQGYFEPRPPAME